MVGVDLRRALPGKAALARMGGMAANSGMCWVM